MKRLRICYSTTGYRLLTQTDAPKFFPAFGAQSVVVLRRISLIIFLRGMTLLPVVHSIYPALTVSLGSTTRLWGALP